MDEGWFAEQHFVLFTEAEARSAITRYGIAEALPGYSLLGLAGWDNFLLRSPVGETFIAPTVPLGAGTLSPLEVPPASSLEPDSRFAGRVKWYVKPIAFGGDPSAKENLVWVSHQQHQDLVAWWNAKYREIKGSSAGA